jgi:hypothetical protein
MASPCFAGSEPPRPQTKSVVTLLDTWCHTNLLDCARQIIIAHFELTEYGSQKSQTFTKSKGDESQIAGPAPNPRTGELQKSRRPSPNPRTGELQIAGPAPNPRAGELQIAGPAPNPRAGELQIAGPAPIPPTHQFGRRQFRMSYNRRTGPTSACERRRQMRP